VAMRIELQVSKTTSVNTMSALRRNGLYILRGSKDHSGEAYSALATEMAAIARTPVLPRANHVGPLSAEADRVDGHHPS
jgi:hypothetical protein